MLYAFLCNSHGIKVLAREYEVSCFTVLFLNNFAEIFVLVL